MWSSHEIVNSMHSVFARNICLIVSCHCVGSWFKIIITSANLKFLVTCSLFWKIRCYLSIYPAFRRWKIRFRRCLNYFFFNQHDARVNLCKKLDIFFYFSADNRFNDQLKREGTKKKVEILLVIINIGTGGLIKFIGNFLKHLRSYSNVSYITLIP